MYDQSEGTEKSDHCRQVALTAGLTVRKVELKK